MSIALAWDLPVHYLSIPFLFIYISPKMTLMYIKREPDGVSIIGFNINLTLQFYQYVTICKAKVKKIQNDTIKFMVKNFFNLYHTWIHTRARADTHKHTHTSFIKGWGLRCYNWGVFLWKGWYLSFCKCLLCMYVFCLFTSFLSVLFMFHMKSLVL